MFKNSTSVVLATSGIALGLGLLGSCTKPTSGPNPTTGPSGGDDPVVMAGGSMRFVTIGHKLDVDTADNKKLHHVTKTKKMNQADILYSNNNVAAFQTVSLNSSPNLIEIDYCSGDVQNGACTGSPVPVPETIKIQSGNGGKGIDIITNRPLSSPANSSVVEYPAPPGRISQIRINGQRFDCPSQGSGNCTMTIHYK